MTEDRAVLHTALRLPRTATLHVDGRDVVGDVNDVLDKWLVSRTRSGQASGRATRANRIKTIVNIGIGGSDLGPVMAHEALRHYIPRDLDFRYVSNVDGTDIGLRPSPTSLPMRRCSSSRRRHSRLKRPMNNAQSARTWALRSAW